jgi:hypothetical protein
MAAVFLSYRRATGRADIAWVRLLHRSLADSFDVFFDRHGIEYGDDFPNEIAEALGDCQVFFPVIGPEWVRLRQLKRLAKETDWVRREILTVLGNARVRVIPLLVGGAALPDAADLPEVLHPLLRRNAISMSAEKWDSDCQDLARHMQGWLSVQATQSAARQTLPPVLPYLCDRVPQEESLADRVQAAGHRHPLCILHGHRLESHDGFLDRLKHKGFLDELFASRADGVAVCRLEWNREKARAGQYDDLLRRAIKRNAMQSLLATDDALGAFLADPGQAMVLAMQLTWEDYRTCGGEAMLNGLEAAWNGLFADIEPASPLVLWINVSYDEADQSLPQTGLEGLLPRLDAISRGHVEEWLGLDEVRRFARGREERFMGLTEAVEYCCQPGKLHMLRFAEAVREILNPA